MPSRCSLSSPGPSRAMPGRVVLLLEVALGLVVLAAVLRPPSPARHALGVRRRRAASRGAVPVHSRGAHRGSARRRSSRDRGDRRGLLRRAGAQPPCPRSQPPDGADRVHRRRSAHPVLPALDGNADRPKGVHPASRPRHRRPLACRRLHREGRGRIPLGACARALAAPGSTSPRPLARTGGGDARSSDDRRRDRPVRHRSPQCDPRRRTRHRSRLEHPHPCRGSQDRTTTGAGRASSRNDLRPHPRGRRYRGGSPCSASGDGEGRKRSRRRRGGDSRCRTRCSALARGARGGRRGGCRRGDAHGGATGLLRGCRPSSHCRGARSLSRRHRLAPRGSCRRHRSRRAERRPHRTGRRPGPRRLGRRERLPTRRPRTRPRRPGRATGWGA